MLTADVGVVTESDAVEVTAITSEPNGSDATGLGTPDNPFRSLTQAVSVAQAGDSIGLGDGNYDQANGETFPVDVSGIDIIGTSEAGTVIDGTGVSGTVDGLEILSGTTSIVNLTVQNEFAVGIHISEGDTILSSVTSSGHTLDGIEVNGTETVTLTDVTVSGNGEVGLRVVTSGTPAIGASNLTSTGNVVGVLTGSARYPKVRS